MKKFFILFAILFALTSCDIGQQPNAVNNISANSQEVSDKKTQVSASIIPLASIINRVGGDYVEVQTIVPAGVSPHGFDLSARKVAEMSDDQAIFMIGSDEID